MTDEAFIEAAKEQYGSDDVLIQELVMEPLPDTVVDRLDDGGAWVMAWVYVSGDKGAPRDER